MLTSRCLLYRMARAVREVGGEKGKRDKRTKGFEVRSHSVSKYFGTRTSGVMFRLLYLLPNLLLLEALTLTCSTSSSKQKANSKQQTIL